MLQRDGRGALGGGRDTSARCNCPGMRDGLFRISFSFSLGVVGAAGLGVCVNTIMDVLPNGPRSWTTRASLPLRAFYIFGLTGHDLAFL